MNQVLIPLTHPGAYLQEEFLEPLGLTAYRLAKDLGVAQTRISQILKGARAITPATALRLARYFGTSPEFWVNLQAQYDLDVAKEEMGERIAQEVHLRQGLETAK